MHGRSVRRNLDQGLLFGERKLEEALRCIDDVVAVFLTLAPLATRVAMFAGEEAAGMLVLVVATGVVRAVSARDEECERSEEVPVAVAASLAVVLRDSS